MQKKAKNRGTCCKYLDKVCIEQKISSTNAARASRAKEEDEEEEARSKSLRVRKRIHTTFSIESTVSIHRRI